MATNDFETNVTARKSNAATQWIAPMQRDTAAGADDHPLRCEHSTIGQPTPVFAGGSHCARLAGFSLIEILIVVAIVGILAAIALPSYRDHVIKTNRSAAQQFMSDVSNREEQYLLDQRSYSTTIGAGGLSTTPTSDVQVNYTFAAATTGNDCNGNAAVAPYFVITATAISSQAVDGNLCLDSRGNKTPTTKWAP